jgi:hypothetical protein
MGTHTRAIHPLAVRVSAYCMLILCRSLLKKCWVTLAIMLMTSSVYMGSSIYSPAITQTMTYFGLGQVTATLGLSLFVVGYVSPLLYFNSTSPPESMILPLINYLQLRRRPTVPRSHH